MKKIFLFILILSNIILIKPEMIQDIQKIINQKAVEDYLKKFNDIFKDIITQPSTTQTGEEAAEKLEELKNQFSYLAALRKVSISNRKIVDDIISNKAKEKGIKDYDFKTFKNDLFLYWQLLNKTILYGSFSETNLNKSKEYLVKIKKISDKSIDKNIARLLTFLK